LSPRGAGRRFQALVWTPWENVFDMPYYHNILD
jgi:hypothetical protein